jgi:hypothetical protein
MDHRARNGPALADPILPSHAWMIGIVAAPDGNLIAPPSASGPDHGLADVDEATTDRAADVPCTCPDFCAHDHEADDR